MRSTTNTGEEEALKARILQLEAELAAVHENEKVKCPRCGGTGRYSYGSAPEVYFGCPSCSGGLVTRAKANDLIDCYNKYSNGRQTVEHV